MSGSPAHALWSPHRDSREVILWKSLLSFRPEPWHWVEHSDAAQWYVVDVSRGVEPDLTARLAADRRLRGIALARQWLDLPAPVWTFFKVPLVTGDVHRWLDAELRGAAVAVPPAAPPTPPALPATDDAPWLRQRLRLTRWPDVGRYGEDAISLTVACSMMLRDWTPYEQLAGVARTRASLMTLLDDARRRGILQSMPDGPPGDAAPPTSPTTTTSGPEDESRWGLLKKIWKRFQ